MGQAASFSIGKRTTTKGYSDEVVLKNIKFKGDFVDEPKANGACYSITQNKGSYLEKSNLNRKQGDRPTTPSSITLVERSSDERFVSANHRTPKHQGSSYGLNDKEEAHSGRYKKEIAILETKSQELREENDRPISSSSYTQNDDDREYKESYEKKIERLETEVQQLKEEKNKMTASSTKPLGGSRKVRKDYKKRIKTLEAEVQQLKEEKHKLFTRLSEISAVQLTENNPNIADLSDANRPDKLAVQMSEIYDNEWTDAFEYLTQIEGLQDEETVRQLLHILQTIYTVCLESTKKQAEHLKNAMLSYLGIPGETKDDFTLKEVLKKLRECRAKQFESILGRIVKDARDQFIDQLERKDCGILDKYIQKCAHVCWFMCIKDPQMYLDFGRSQMIGPPDDDANDFLLHFDTTQFVSYTRAGMYVEYVVWPAVYLYKNGPIMKRGVAQGLNGEPEAKESTVEETGENSNIIGDTINVDADQGYNGDNSNNDIVKRKDEDGCISHNPPGTDDMAQETVKENAQNLKPDSDRHDDLSDAEDCDVSNINTEVTNSDGNDGYARLSYASNESKEDENVLCQDEFHTEEPIFGNDVSLENGEIASFKEQTIEAKTNGN